LGFISTLLTQRKCICLLFYWTGSEFSVTKTEQAPTGLSLAGAASGVCLDPLQSNCAVTMRLFLLRNQEIQVEEHVPCASGTGDRISRWRSAVVQVNGGQRLRALRESLGYRMRDVELASDRIAQRFENEEFSIPPSRLSDIETKGVVPSIFRLYSFAAIYRRDYRELLSFYGLELDGI